MRETQTKMSIWSWGANSHGQLGQGFVSEQVETSRAVGAAPCGKVARVVCGGGHSLLIDNEGKLFVCGWNHKLQLGTEKQCSSQFERLWNLSGIKFLNIAAGWDFSCGITEDKFLFVWGSNSHGQLGLPRNHFPENVKPIRLQVNACEVSMGLRHSAIVNSKGEVWITGSGKQGQLGHGPDVKELDRFKKVPKVGKISHIACGQNHTIAWSTEEAALYVWGDNKHGQLLLNTEKYPRIFFPQKIDIDVQQTVKKLLSGWTNVALWLDDGKLLTWGRNTYGQLGSGTTDARMLTHVSLSDNREILDLALGSEHTVCLATDGTLWAWGWNEHSNTGTDRSVECIFTPTLVPFEAGRSISSVFAGGGHNFVVCQKLEELCNRFESDKDSEEK